MEFQSSVIACALNIIVAVQTNHLSKMFVNKSALIEDPDHTSHEHHGFNQDGSWQNLRTATTAISIIISLLAVLLDAILIFVIKRYSALKTRNNQYLFHFASSNILYLCSNSVLHLVMDVFFEGFLPKEWYCSLVQLENYFLNLCVVFIAMYSLDEYARVLCQKNFLSSYINGFKYFIGSVYIVHVILMFIVSSICFSETDTVRFDVSFIIVTVTYGLLLFGILKIKFTSTKNSSNNQTQLLLIVLEVTLFVFLFYFPLIVYYNVLNIFDASEMEGKDTWVYFTFIPEYLAYSATFILIYKLYKLNKFFKLAFCKVMCKTRKDMDYGRLDTVPEELSNK